MKPIPVIQAPPAGTEIPEPTNDTASLQADAARTQALKPAILDAIRTVFDPEIPVNIYDMGMIYEVRAEPNGYVYVRMTLTSPACPVAGTLPPEVEQKIKAIPGVTGAKVEIVWDPPWDMNRMSEAAKLQLGFF